METLVIDKTNSENISNMFKQNTSITSIVSEVKMTRAQEDTSRAQKMLSTLANEISNEHIKNISDLSSAIQIRIAEIDEAVSMQINEILHTDKLQKIESAWRGLENLVQNVETSTRLKIKLLTASKKDLFNDLEKACEFDQSSLFKKIYESEYGMFGGAPYGILVGDYEFSNTPHDIALLEKISNVSAAAHAPFITAAGSEMFQMDSFEELDVPRDLSKLFSQQEYIRWRAFRNTEDSRYVSLVLPHYLARMPYGRETNPVEEFDFEENIQGKHENYLWGNSAYLYAEKIADAFAKYGWCSAIRGVEGGGLVDNLSIHLFSTEDGEKAVQCPTEIAITDRREKELSDLGFVSLVHCKGTSYAAFFGAQSTNKPKKYVESDATENAELSARIPYLLATSRIAHYLKSIVRDKVGGFASKSDMQNYLEKWINQYVLLDDNATMVQKSKRPLREAKILVEEIAGEPGSYQACAWIRPHFQLETMKVSLRLVAKLPSSIGK